VPSFKKDLEVLKKHSIDHLFPYIRTISETESIVFVLKIYKHSLFLFLLRTKTIFTGNSFFVVTYKEPNILVAPL